MNKINYIINNTIHREQKYNDNEINSLSYKKAIKKDKRRYIEYYLSLLRTKHPFVFSFCYNKDYNSKIIKIDLFFINFIIYYSINAIFFNDDTMHKIYENEGDYTFLYEIVHIVYTTLICSGINTSLKLLSLSEKNIL